MHVNHPRDDSWMTRMLTQLKVIAQIEKGDKLCTQAALFYIEPSSSTQCVRRMFNGESRTRNLQRVQSVVSQFIEHVQFAVISQVRKPHGPRLVGGLLPTRALPAPCSGPNPAGGDEEEPHSRYCRDGSEEQQCAALSKRCLSALKLTVTGLRNLSYSYTNDACAMAQIDCIIENIDDFVHRCGSCGDVGFGGGTTSPMSRR